MADSVGAILFGVWSLEFDVWGMFLGRVRWVVVEVQVKYLPR